MKEVRFFYAPDAATTHELPEEEAQHAVRVLRLDAGDEIMLMDGKGSFYLAEITEATKKRCFYQLKESLPQSRQWQGHLHLAMAPTKNLDRVEWLAEKATEIGFDELTFLNCKFSERKVRKVLLKDVLKAGEDALVMVGPEGDFSVDEVLEAERNGFQSVSLGDSRLRTETAALIAVHLMNLFN